MLDDVHARVQEGATLADAMARHPRAFSELATSIVRAGGEGGFLEEALERLAKFTEQQDELKSRVVGRAGLSDDSVHRRHAGRQRADHLLRAEVRDAVSPASRTRRIARRHRLAAVAQPRAAVVRHVHRGRRSSFVGLVIRKRLQTEEGRVVARPLAAASCRWSSSIYLSLAVSRFCRVLGTLLTNGVPIVRSLEISADSTGNRVLSTAIREAAENISAGESLAEPLAASGHFPADVVEMIAVGRAIEQPRNRAAAHRRHAGTRHLAAAGFVRPAAGAADAADAGRRGAGRRDRPAAAGVEDEHDGM